MIWRKVPGALEFSAITAPHLAKNLTTHEVDLQLYVYSNSHLMEGIKCGRKKRSLRSSLYQKETR